MKFMLAFFILAFSFGAAAQNSASTKRQSRSNQFNPAMGLNILSLYKNSSRDVETDGHQLQEVELMFTADVDAYFRAVAIVGIHEVFESHEGESEEEHEGHAHGSSYEVHPEEVYAETIAIPTFTLKVGRFLSAFGKQNSVHAHALPLIERPYLHQGIFGSEPLTESGLSVSFLLPLAFYSEMTFEALQPTNPRLFESERQKTAAVLKIKNLWDLSESLTFELGLSSLSHATPAREHEHDENETDEEHEEEVDHEENNDNTTRLLGADTTFKWRPMSGGTSSSFVFSAEYMQLERKELHETKKTGYFGFVRYQFMPRWHAQLSSDSLKVETEEAADVKMTTQAVLIGFAPTEFSLIRAQYDTTDDGGDKKNNRLLVQLNYAIGAHPAHQY